MQKSVHILTPHPQTCTNGIPGRRQRHSGEATTAPPRRSGNAPTARRGGNGSAPRAPVGHPRPHAPLRGDSVLTAGKRPGDSLLCRHIPRISSGFFLPEGRENPGKTRRKCGKRQESLRSLHGVSTEIGQGGAEGAGAPSGRRREAERAREVRRRGGEEKRGGRRWPSPVAW